MNNICFNSDTTAPVCVEVMKKLLKINKGQMLGYSRDEYTFQATNIIKNLFTIPVEVFFLPSGSACNILAIKSIKDNYSAIICCEDTHINTCEVGGVEYNTGCKILTSKSEDAKLNVDMIKSHLYAKIGYSHAQPKIVVLSQITELGTCYTVSEIKRICDFCHKNDMYVYVDGARLSNAIVSQNCTIKQMMQETGVDVFSIGGNKNGCMFGEVLVFLNNSLAKNFILNQKQSMQLFSKTRYLAGQFLALFENNLWQKNAKHANDMAQYFKQKLNECGVHVAYKVEGNILFAKFNKKQLSNLKETYLLDFYDYERPNQRLMTNFATTKKEIDSFIRCLKQEK